jgi:mannose-6-phosphate isomerase-like protein (cupin superfamily)
VSEPYIVNRDELATGDGSPEFVGAGHPGGARLCLILVDARPGGGPRLHRHPYEEVFVVQEGRATYVVGETEYEVGAGDIVVVPAGLPHRFVNSGDGPLRQLDIHVSPRFQTEWLE